MCDLTQKTIKSMLKYEPSIGDFYRLKYNRSPNENGTCGRVDKRGNKVIDFKGRTYPAVLLVWIYMTGSVPPKDKIIGFRNGQKLDTRFENLYLFPRSFLQMGVSKRGNENNLPPGVVEHRDNPESKNVRFSAAVMYKRKRINLGSFPTIKRAERAYRSAILELSENGTVTVIRKNEPIIYTFT